MTERDYWINPYEQEFKATIIGVTSDAIILDRTLFYPMGGGQTSDRGVISAEIDDKSVEFHVDDVSLQNDFIIHRIRKDEHELLKKLEIGKEVTGIIDWDYRYGCMKAHTSQHLLSALIEREFGAETGEVLIKSESVLLKLNKPITTAQLERILKEANEYTIKRALNIKSEVLNEEEARQRCYDSDLFRGSFKKLVGARESGKSADEIPDIEQEKTWVKTSEKIRVLEIEGIDLMCCGGTHVSKTTEIGPIFVERFNKGTEIKYNVGYKAAIKMAKLNVDAIQIAHLFNDSTFNIKDAAQKREDKLRLRQSELAELTKDYLDLIFLSKVNDEYKDENKDENKVENKDEYKDGNKVENKESQVQPKLIQISKYIDRKNLSSYLKKVPKNSIVVQINTSRQISVISSCEQYPALDIIKYINTELGGKGGGNANKAQGKIPEDLDEEIVIKKIKQFISKK